MVLVDEDTEAFNRIMSTFGLPKSTDEEKAARSQAIQEATLFATEVPLHTMKASYKVFELCRAMAEEGNPNSVSDAGVGVLAARAGCTRCRSECEELMLAGLKDKEKAEHLVAEANKLIAQANEAEAEIIR